MQRLVTALDAVKATRSRKEKIAHLAALLAALEGEELAFSSRLILGQLLPTGDARVIGVGWALLGAAAAKVIGIREPELSAKVRALGDFGEALEVLMPARDTALALREVPAIIDALAETTDRAIKLHLLTTLFSKAAPAEAKYVGKALLGELRIGVQRGTFEEALAKAFDAPLEALRHAAALTVDPGELALLAKSKQLETAHVRVGHVVASMLATPMESVKDPIDLALTVAEDKLDGIRTQAHVTDDRTVRLFGRGQDEITDSFPEVVEVLKSLPRATVLDGEIIAVTAQGRVRPFQALQARLGRVAPDAAVRAKTPVHFVAFDVMFDGHSLLGLPWHERRAHLEGLPLKVNAYTPLDPKQSLEAQLEAHFIAARGRGHEGLMLKRTDSLYEAGKRGSAWRKMKRPFGTLDCVITKAERGHGKRAGVLSDYTFAVWAGDELVDIGKAYSGLTDVEIADLTKRLEAITLEQRGGSHLVTPTIVLEIAFDGLQASRRHASGLAMRFPRILRIRDDKKPEDADTLETARGFLEAQIETGHREAAPQLDLFK